MRKKPISLTGKETAVEGNLRVWKIRIRNLGTIDDLTLLFNKRIALVEGTAWREILLAFRIICGGELSKEETDCFKPGFEIEAELLPGGRRCHVIYETDSLTGEIRWKIRPLGDGDADDRETERNVRQYLRDIPEKRRLRVLYDLGDQGILKRFLEYRQEELQEKNFEDTGGLCTTSAFKACLEGAIEAEKEKSPGSGRDRAIVTFFQLNHFWEEIEEERGIGTGKGPLILTDKKKTVTEKGTKAYLKEMRRRYEGQLIIVLNQEEENGRECNQMQQRK